MTIENLLSLGVSQSLAQKFISPLNKTLAKYEINTPLRMAHFFAQCLHESGMLRYTQEIADGSAYEGREDLGNRLPGDGKLFKGRGLIQLTGRTTYLNYGLSLGENIQDTPEKVAQPDIAADSAGWFWQVFKKNRAGKNLNDMADSDDILMITYFVNGGFNGLQDRFRLLKKGYQTFGVDNPQTRMLSHLAKVQMNLSTPDRKGMMASLARTIPNLEAYEKLKYEVMR